METVIKVAKSRKIPSKAGSRGDKCLAKFTSSNSCVFGSLTLDIRKAAEDYTQELPVAVRVSYDSQKVFLRLGAKYTTTDRVNLCDYEKTGRRVQQTERNGLKDLLDGVEMMTNQLIAEGNFSLRRLKDRFQGRKDDVYTIYSIWCTFV